MKASRKPNTNLLNPNQNQILFESKNVRIIRESKHYYSIIAFFVIIAATKFVNSMLQFLHNTQFLEPHSSKMEPYTNYTSMQ